MTKELYDKASEVIADDGKVLVDGPDGVVVALTRDAALEIADRLTEQSVRAVGQEHEGAEVSPFSLLRWIVPSVLQFTSQATTQALALRDLGWAPAHAREATCLITVSTY
jgi:hypothetical protein